MHETASIHMYINQLQRTVAAGPFRGLLVLSGDKAWAEALLVPLCAGTERRLWVGDAAQGGLPVPAGMPVISGKQAQQVLGQERDLLVFDGWSGFNPNGFGQVSGVVVAGGLLILVVPPLAEWPAFADPEYRSLAVLPYTVEAVGRRFIQRLCRIIRADTALQLVEQGQPLPALPGVQSIPPVGAVAPYRSADQQRVVETLQAHLGRRNPAPVVLTADRGRGKSAALGLVAAQLLQQGAQVLVTAPSQGAVEALFNIAQQHWPGCERTPAALCNAGVRLAFQLPDQILAASPPADILLVDEAAAIPAPVLQRLLLCYRKVIFASTIHGYEGTGQGFNLRFRRVLERHCPGWRALTMCQPVRWAEGDPLEAFTFRALLLDAEPASNAQLQGTTAENPPVRFVPVPREQLLQDEALLHELFGLLVLAHYRTTPGDLRILLDSPNLQVWAAFCGASAGDKNNNNNNGEHLVATALLAEEGPLAQPLADEIWAGRRRPKGHLIPQTLLAQDGIQAAAHGKGLRVMRIAVHPARQRAGVGLALLQQIEVAARGSGVDWLGSSFGLTDELHQFWCRAGFNTLRVGFGRDHVSGTHAALMLKPLSSAAQALQYQVQERLREQIAWLLVEPLRDLEPRLVLRVLAELAVSVTLSHQDRLDGIAFASTERQYDNCRVALRKLVLAAAGRGALQALDEAQQQLLVRAVLQGHDWPKAAAGLQIHSPKLLIKRLRQTIGQLLQADATAPDRSPKAY